MSIQQGIRQFNKHAYGTDKRKEAQEYIDDFYNKVPEDIIVWEDFDALFFERLQEELDIRAFEDSITTEAWGVTKTDSWIEVEVGGSADVDDYIAYPHPDKMGDEIEVDYEGESVVLGLPDVKPVEIAGETISHIQGTV